MPGILRGMGDLHHSKLKKLSSRQCAIWALFPATHLQGKSTWGSGCALLRVTERPRDPASIPPVDAADDEDDYTAIVIQIETMTATTVMTLSKQADGLSRPDSSNQPTGLQRHQRTHRSRRPHKPLKSHIASVAMTGIIISVTRTIIFDVITIDATSDPGRVNPSKTGRPAIFPITVTKVSFNLPSK